MTVIIIKSSHFDEKECVIMRVSKDIIDDEV